jgi:hypothetical protein
VPSSDPKAIVLNGASQDAVRFHGLARRAFRDRSGHHTFLSGADEDVARV